MVLGLTIFSAISFLFFGLSCLFTPYMRNEFVRYGLKNWRPVIGVLQLLGSIGLFLGYLYLPVLSIIAAGGLSVLMLLGFGVRLKIRDSVLQSAPSLFFALLNGLIVVLSLKNDALI